MKRKMGKTHWVIVLMLLFVSAGWWVALVGFTGKPLNEADDYVIHLRSNEKGFVVKNVAGTQIFRLHGDGSVYMCATSVCPAGAGTSPGTLWCTGAAGNPGSNQWISDGAGGQEAARNSCVYAWSEGHWCPFTVAP
jgi:hypothetical protein